MYAAVATPATDVLSDHSLSASSNHTIRIKTPTGIDAPTDTVTYDISGFTVGALGVGDIDIFHGAVSGMENADAHAAVAGVGVWGIGIAGGTITLTPPTDAGVGTVPAGNFINLLIGTNAAGGVNRLANPAVISNIRINIGGGFGDSTQIAVPIFNGDVSVTATVLATAPVLTSISPSSVMEGSVAFVMTLTGSNFMPDSIVRLNGSDRVTTFVNANQLTATIPASDIATMGTRSMTVWSPTPALLSNALTLTVTSAGGGPPSDTVPPVISNVQAINITDTTARIIWDTDEAANSLVNYGLTVVYSDSVSNGSLVLSHGLDLSGLTPSTLYHFKVTSADQYGNTVSSADYTFTTLAAPALVISNVTTTAITDTSAIVVWDTNRVATSHVEYGTSPALGMTATVPGNVTNHAVPLTGLTENTLYYYQVTSVDTWGNTAVSQILTFKTTTDLTPPTNVVLTATPGDTVVLLQWTNPIELDYAGVRIMRRTGGYPTGPADGDFVYQGANISVLDVGRTNGTMYYYAAYAYDTHGNFASGSLAQARPMGTIQQPPTSTPPVIPTPTSTPPVVIPVVPIVPGGTVTSTQPIPPVAVTSTPAQITINPLYYAAGGTLLLQAGDDGRYGVLGGSSVLVHVPTSNLGASVNFVVAEVNGHSYSLTVNSDGTAFVGTFSAPTDGEFVVTVRAIVQNGQEARAESPFTVQFGGRVVEEELGTQGRALPGAEVTLFVQEGGEWRIWNSAPYGQANPTISDGDGYYAFVVPNGTYYVSVRMGGYESSRSSTINVQHNVFGARVSLIKKPKPLVVTSTFPFIANIPERLTYTALSVQKVVRAPELVQMTNEYVAPGLLAVSILNSATALSLFNFLAYLQFLFTQPILLFGRLRRKRWGTLYNSLTKQPIEFVIVRLVHLESRLTVQTVVTDKHGRYVFHVHKGNYLIEASKPSYEFPTQYLADVKEDVDYVDLYHGESIAADEDQTLALNIPMDPVSVVETPKQILYRQFVKKLQHSISLLGVFLAFAALIISPSVLVGLIAFVQIGFYLLFRKLAIPTKAKPWGVVFDSKTHLPVKNAIIRIFEKKYNKLLETQLTDKNGQYGFFADKNVYYVTVEKAGYTKAISKDIDLLTRKETVVDLNIALEASGTKS